MMTFADENNNIVKQPGTVEQYYHNKRKIQWRIFEVTHNITNQKRIIKEIITKSDRYSWKKLEENEIRAILLTRHENIIRCEAIFETETHMYVVLELLQGFVDCYELLVERETCSASEKESKHIILQIVNALECLHAQGIAHLTLLLQNVLVFPDTPPLKIKIAPFGVGNRFQYIFGICRDFSTDAPEMFQGKSLGKEVDMWYLGAVCFIMLTGCYPFFDETSNYVKLSSSILSGVYEYPTEPVISNLAKDFISTLLVVDPEKRATPEQCINHPWLQSIMMWKFERFLWIGHLKEDESNCIFASLPKDIIREIAKQLKAC